MKAYELKPPENNINFEEFYPFKEKLIKYDDPKISEFSKTVCSVYTKNPEKERFWLISLIKKFLQGKKIIIKKKSFFIIESYSDNYFHWLNDILPKIYYLEKKGAKESILLPESLLEYEFIKDTLKCFDLKFRIIGKNEIVFSKTLYCVEPVAGWGTQNKELLNEAIQKVKNKYNTRTNQTDKEAKIYITRRNTLNRRTLPTNALETFLEKKGYKIIEAESLSFIDQVKLFSNCSGLIGVHGAGLTNMIFMEKGSKVMEIKRIGDIQNYCYYFMANAMQHLYFIYSADGVSNNSLQDDDLLVIMEEFEVNFKAFDK